MASKDHFHSIVATVQPVVHGVAEDQLGNPSPCEEWTVRDVANHFLGTTEAMRPVVGSSSRSRAWPSSAVRDASSSRSAWPSWIAVAMSGPGPSATTKRESIPTP